MSPAALLPPPPQCGTASTMELHHDTEVKEKHSTWRQNKSCHCHFKGGTHHPEFTISEAESRKWVWAAGSS
jgi:hypothetical protein